MMVDLAPFAHGGNVTALIGDLAALFGRKMQPKTPIKQVIDVQQVSHRYPSSGSSMSS